MNSLFKLLGIGLWALCLVGTGCADLTYQPLDAAPAGTAITDVNAANAAVLGAYDALQNPDLVFDGYLALPQLFSDECIHTGTFPSRAEFARLDVFPENTTLAAVFSGFYQAINVCNTVIEQLEAVDDPRLTTELALQYEGELRFVRAFCYWHLVNNWGNVPLVLTSTTLDRTDTTSLNVPNNSPEEIRAQIEEDLLFAEMQLPALNAMGARATQDAARAMLARYYLFKGEYQQALNYAELIINSGNYALEADYGMNFGVERGDAEQIWYLNFTELDNNANAFFYFPSNMGGRLSLSPSPDLIAAFDSTDRRLAYTISNGHVIKYQDINTGTDPLYFIRYAEILLIAAEASAATSSFDRASIYFNQVRQRAGLKPIFLRPSNYVSLLLHERMTELAFEGSHRLWDLRRTGQAGTVLAGFGYDVGKDEYWPIPQRELDRNPKLVQNPGYN